MFDGLARFWRRALFYSRRGRFESELEEEMRAHLELSVKEHIASGMSLQDARRSALRQFGNRTLLREVSREMWSFNSLETLVRDARFGLRMLAKHPAFSAVAALSLALGIGANTAIFSVVYGVLINPYPYAAPGEIWAPRIQAVQRARGRGPYRLSEYLEVARLPAFASVMATGWESVLLTGDRAPESFRGVLMSGNAFNFLGVPPELGRTIQPSDIRPSGEAEPVVVLSHLLWQRLFDGDPGALGKQLRLNEEPHTVVGVMPPRFGWYGNDSFWLPLPTIRGNERFVNPIVRLRPGVTKQAAEEQLHALHLSLAKEKPENFPRDGFTTSLMNYLDITVASGEMQSSLRLLFGAVGFLLLIACANVANLQLARGSARTREIAVRTAIGAGRGRVVRQLLTESVLLSLIGGALGILFAIAATRAIVAFMPEFYVPNEARITVNGWVLLFTFTVSVLTGILSGLAPALRAARPELTEALKDATRGAGVSAGSRRLRDALVVIEVALAVVLLVGASLIARSFIALHRVDPGFRPGRVLIVSLPLPPKRYATIEARNNFAREVLARVHRLPGVEAATIGNGGMPFYGTQSTYSVEGQARAEESRLALSLIGADYLRTMGIALRSGRELSAQEVELGDRVALINETARRLWPADIDPIGRRISIDALARPGAPDFLVPAGGLTSVTVIGVIADVKNAGLQREPVPAAFVPYTLLAPSWRMLAVRTQGEPLSMLNAVRGQVLAVDRDQPLGRPSTLEEQLGYEVQQPRFNVALFGLFALIGLALTMAGIYSVLSYHVTYRTHEIGIRMALGAGRRDVLALVLGMGARLVGFGLAAGLLASLLLTRFLQSLLFRVGANDPASILTVALLLSAAALLACYMPARRAAHLDPLSALRHE
jgi:predicted permease